MLPEQQPCAYKLLSSIELDNNDIIEMSTYLKKYHVDANIAARIWINNHPEIWESWVKGFPSGHKPHKKSNNLNIKTSKDAFHFPLNRGA